MTRHLVCVIVVMFSAVATSAAGQRDARPGSGGTGTIRGRVIAGDTSLRVRDVVVSLRSVDADEVLVRAGIGRITAGTRVPVTRADADGRFEIVGVPPGRYRLGVDTGPAVAAYLPVRYPDPAAESAEPVIIAANQVVDEIVIALPRAAAITGRVLDDRGQPVALVSVTAHEALPGGRRRIARGFAPGAAARTDDLGAFRLFGLRAGEYLIVAQTARQLYLAGEVPTGVLQGGNLPPLFYGGNVSSGQAAPIRVSSGEEHGPIDIVVTPVRLLAIRGQLLDPDGQPVPNVNVTMRREDALTTTGMQSQATRPDGTFELKDVPQGKCTILVNRYGPQMSQFASLPLTVDDNIEGLTIHLQNGVTVKGQVVFEGQAPVPLPTMYVRSGPDKSGGSVNAVRVMPTADLSFTLESQFGSTLIGVEPPAGWHLKAVLYGGRDVTDQPIEFEPGGPALQVVLTQRAASLSGLVRSGAGLPAEASVVIFSEDPALWSERPSTTRIIRRISTGSTRRTAFAPAGTWWSRL